MFIARKLLLILKFEILTDFYSGTNLYVCAFYNIYTQSFLLLMSALWVFIPKIDISFYILKINEVCKCIDPKLHFSHRAC